jgi:hypothetical protein
MEYFDGVQLKPVFVFWMKITGCLTPGSAGPGRAGIHRSIEDSKPVDRGGAVADYGIGIFGMLRVPFKQFFVKFYRFEFTPGAGHKTIQGNMHLHDEFAH